mmetsp:Transcript_99660/g.182778  ORF Transcript_99660/g.182778 Transcript_99660/m.182778 type:complete len:239 (-) Transcript_99660:835-1551(-)
MQVVPRGKPQGTPAAWGGDATAAPRGRPRGTPAASSVASSASAQGSPQLHWRAALSLPPQQRLHQQPRQWAWPHGQRWRRRLPRQLQLLQGTSSWRLRQPLSAETGSEFRDRVDSDSGCLDSVQTQKLFLHPRPFRHSPSYVALPPRDGPCISHPHPHSGILLLLLCFRIPLYVAPSFDISGCPLPAAAATRRAKECRACLQLFLPPPPSSAETYFRPYLHRRSYRCCSAKRSGSPQT